MKNVLTVLLCFILTQSFAQEVIQITDFNDKRLPSSLIGKLKDIKPANINKFYANGNGSLMLEGKNANVAYEAKFVGDNFFATVYSVGENNERKEAYVLYYSSILFCCTPYEGHEGHSCTSGEISSYTQKLHCKGWAVCK